MPLDIIVVGAGIGGLCAAVALRQAGHRVKIFEKSSFATEIGAAIALAPNGSRVLSSLGFSYERARACLLPEWLFADGITLEKSELLDFSSSEEKYGFPFRSIHRIDFHNELLRLAREGKDNPVTLNLASPIERVDAEECSLTLANGTKYSADLIIGADGVRSVTRLAVIGPEADKPSRTNVSTFRFLTPTKKLEADPALHDLVKWKSKGITILDDKSDKEHVRHITWYPCRDGEVQNVTGNHPSRADSQTQTDMKGSLLDEFKNLHPHVLRFLNLAEDVLCWNLQYYDPFSRWTYKRIVLIGDSAHPMLPFGGQGSNQAMEDAGALGRLLTGVDSREEIPPRLRLYEEVRRRRGSTVQLLSSTVVGREKDVESRLWEFAEPGATKVPNTFSDRTEHAFGFDVLAECDKALRVAALRE
ncbi:putative salicylate hydroxylase [Viridothelium virens]|uniref:Putative salicylate hydroxylase n=1 Tax=Viridothelium virens TaxID=1048519 RepID=A0A6A6H732_VIRVR|nr:putative salicylate hydroxylase [Viridothelium virens]